MQKDTRTILLTVIGAVLVALMIEVVMHRVELQAIRDHDGHVGAALAEHDGRTVGR